MHVRFAAGSHVSSCGSHSSFTLNTTEAASSVVPVVCTGVSVVPTVVVTRMVDVVLVAEVVVKVKAEIGVGSCVIVGVVLVAMVVVAVAAVVVVVMVVLTVVVVLVVTVVVVVVVTVVVVVVAGQPPSPGKQSVALSHARPFLCCAVVTSQFLQCGDASN